MDFDWNTPITVLFGSGGVGALLIKYLLDKRHARKSRRVQQSYARIAEVFKILQFVRLATRATRVCVLKTENGGGVPAPGCDVKSSVLYETADPSMTRELASSWQKVALNGVWAEVLKKLAVDKNVRLTPNPEMGPHYDFLAESDCATVEFALIDLTEAAMYYLSVHLAAGVELTPKEISAVHAGARRINLLFQEGFQPTDGI
jgi:hypothetical protein